MSDKRSAIYSVIMLILFGLFCYKCSAPSPDEKEEYLEKNAFNYTLKYEEDRLREYLLEDPYIIQDKLDEEYEKGRKEGYSEGYNQGFEDGKEEGHEEGYNDGLYDGYDLHYYMTKEKEEDQ